MVESKVPNWNWFTHRVPDRKSKDISNTPDDKKKRYHSKMEAFSSTSNISAKSLSNLASKDSFEISSS